MTITRVHHVQITIPEGAEEEGQRFYCGVLGLRDVPKPLELKNRGGFWLRVGDVDVHVGTETRDRGALTKAHVAYQVSDLAAWRHRFEAAGIEIGDSVPIPGFSRFEIRDPFGNRIEFLEPAPTI
jgi:catechol 2,3-dioxygenase-like lactoylglutathione lyase family enzyme